MAPLNDWIATIPEAVHDRLEQIASAKREPLETADQLLAAAASLEKTAAAGFSTLSTAGALSRAQSACGI